jgi:hypothetical protein
MNPEEHTPVPKELHPPSKMMTLSNLRLLKSCVSAHL